MKGFLLIFSSILAIFFLTPSITEGIKCYVCTDCGGTKYNSSHLQECTKRGQDKCVTMLLQNGETDRGCGDKKRCMGRQAPRRKRELSDSLKEFSKVISGTSLISKKRFVRGLLPTDPGSSPSNGKNKDKEVTKDIDLKMLRCCSGDECNTGTTSWNPIKIYLHLFLSFLLFSVYRH